MKSTILLTTALFLASAPSPDSKVISEISAGFLSLTDTHALMASDTSPDAQVNFSSSTPMPALLLSPDHKRSIAQKLAD